MEQGVQNIQNTDPDIISTDTDAIFADIDNLFDDLQGIIRGENNPTEIESEFQATLSEEETRIMEEEVTYQQNTDVIEERSQYINALEQDRMKRTQQKNLLVDLQKEKIDLLNAGHGYSRNLDEGVQANTTAKELNQIDKTETNIQPGEAVLDEDITSVQPSSEEFEEEFLNLDNTTNWGASEERESMDDREQSEGNDQEVELEDDEVLDLFEDDSIKSFTAQINTKLNIPESYKSETADITQELQDNDIEQRILSIAPVIDRHDGTDHNLMRDIERRIQRSAVFDRKTPPETSPKSAPRKVNKLKAKFRKR